jgi:hypothetical protein
MYTLIALKINRQNETFEKVLLPKPEGYVERKENRAAKAAIVVIVAARDGGGTVATVAEEMIVVEIAGEPWRTRP